MFAPLAQTPRPPGEAGRYECIRRGREAPPNLPTAGAGAGPGGARGWVQRGAFLAPFRRSKRLRGVGVRGRAVSMARAVGAGTRLPRRERARVAGALPGGRGRVVRRYAPLHAASRVSCAGRALETLFLLAALAGVWARSEKKGAVPEGRGPLCACRGTKKIFLSKKSFLSMKRNFFRGAGRTKKARLPGGGRRAEQPGGKDRCGRAFSKPFRR